MSPLTRTLSPETGERGNRSCPLSRLRESIALRPFPAKTRETVGVRVHG